MKLPFSRPPARRLLAAVAAILMLASACGELEVLTTEEALGRLNIASTKLYAADGSLIANLHGEINRDIVPLDEIPEHVQNAVIAIEDRRFWEHRGIDVKSIARAFVQNVRSDDDELQGGSTMSQQLVKNLYFPDPDRTLARKVAEARVTWQFEQEYPKEKILEMYLNTIYFGRGVYGIETAANSYFHKDASDLTVAEAAYLAGLVHEPGSYDFRPDDPPERIEEKTALGVARRNIVLDRMEQEGFLEPEEAEAAAEAPLEIQPRGEQEWTYPYFVDMVLSRLGVLRCGVAPLDPEFDFLGTSCKQRAENVHRGGLRIYTTLDPKAQGAAEEAIAETLPPDEPRLFGSLAAIEPDTGYIRALVGGKDYYPDDCGFAQTPDAPTVEQAVAELRRIAETGADEPDLRARMDQVLHCRFGKLNLALGQAGGGTGRQPGSSFKPVVLAEALKRGVSLYDAFSTSPFTHRYDRGLQTWTVRNYEGSGGGAATLFEGTVNSINAVYAHLEIDGVGEGDVLRGSARVADTARRLGVDFETREELRRAAAEESRPCSEGRYGVGGCIAADDTPSVALGSKEVSPLEMASVYATFANEGVRVEPTAVVRVTDGVGRTLYEADPARDRVLPRDVALAVTEVLSQVIERGTGTRARIDRVAAGKTGTAQQWRDAWFDGFVPQLAAAVWVGNPGQQEEMTPSNGYSLRVVGGSFPALIWQYFMTRALEGVPVERFSPAPRDLFVRRATPAPQVEVPDVLGLSIEDAISELSLDGFGVERTTCYAPDSAEGIVVKQVPAGGATTDQGGTVEVCVSVQALPSPGTNTPNPDTEDDEQPAFSQVPDVIGMAKAEAQIELQQAGYETASVRECGPAGSQDSNSVWKQDPSGGTSAEQGSTVTIWVNPAVC